LRCFALDAHGEAETADFKVGHAAVAHLAPRVGGRRALGRARAGLAALQNGLKCGTNCGSCIPELRRLVRAHPASGHVLQVA
jgi:assimilatory nitrate reductase catalytic subunit